MESRLLALPLAALLLAACSQDLATPTPDVTLDVNGVAADTYVMDLETALPSKILGNVKVGQGITYTGQGEAITDPVRIDGFQYKSGKRFGGNHVKVISASGNNVLTVVKAGTNTPNPTGGELDIKPSQAFGGPSQGKNGLVTLKSVTVNGVSTNGAKLVLYGNGKPIKTISLSKMPSQILVLDEPDVGFIQVRANDSFTVDDVVFEVPIKQPDFAGKEIVGTWSGSAYQAGFGNYSIELAVTKDPNAEDIAGEVAYPSLSCGGTWTLKSSEGSKYIFAEQITYGTNNCVASSDVSVTYNQDDSLTYDWQYYGSSATGPLYRVND